MTIRAGGLVDVADFGDTGWVPLTLAAGYGGTLSARLYRGHIELRGLVSTDTDWGASMSDNQICDSVPSDLQADDPIVIICAGGSSTTTWFRVTINGAFVSIRSQAASATAGVYINHDYLAD